MSREVDPTEHFEVGEIPRQPQGDERERRLRDFRATNLRIVALFVDGHDADSPQLQSEIDLAEDIFTGQVRL